MLDGLDVLDGLVRLVGLVATGVLVVVRLLFSGEIGPLGMLNLVL